jgi:glyoxylase I family protein
MTTDAIGIDHIYIAVADLKVSKRYYDTLMPLMGFKKAHAPIGGDPHLHYYCRHYGFSLRPARSAQRHDPYAPGLHHFCFRLENVEDIDALFEKIKAKGLRVSTPKFLSGIRARLLCDFFRGSGRNPARSGQLQSAT